MSTDARTRSASLQKIIGSPDQGTRIYRREGSDAEIAAWFDSLCEHFPEGLVSPGGVAMYVPVSRAGVHKKIKEGNLTAFCFHVVRSARSMFGYQKKLKERPYVYIPVSECRAWAEELNARPERQRVSSKQDLSDDFLDQDPKDKKNRKVKYVD